MEEIESPEIILCIYEHLFLFFLNKRRKNIQWREETASSLRSVGKTGQLCVKEWNECTSNAIHKNKLKMD